MHLVSPNNKAVEAPTNTKQDRIAARYVHKRGITLVEMLVVVALIVLLASVALARYRDFESITILESSAYDLALAIREAQVLGVSVRGQSLNFEPAYGIHLDLSRPDEYILFWDLDNGNDFDPGEDVTLYTIGNGITLTELCMEADCEADTLDILFKRPSPDAIFAREGVVDTERNIATVTITSSKTKRQVQVTRVGNIAVLNE